MDSGPFHISFEGRPVAARVGQSVVAALTGAGVRELRETRSTRNRGMFCGMGVCQDCLVEIDGVPSRRACMEPARPGLSVRRQSAFPDLLAANSESDSLPPPARQAAPDILILGAGVGGLAAAISARKSGAEVLVLDERHVHGGQFYKQTAVGGGPGPLDRQQRAGAKLIDAALQSGAELVPGAEVWGAFDGPVVYARTREGDLVIRPRVLVVATGAYERPRMIPGWDLPGVMTTGAAQTLWRSYRVLPGARVAFAGNGPLNLQVAREVMRGGARVPLIAEAAPPPGRRMTAVARMTMSDPGLTLAGLGMAGWLRAKGAGLRFDTVLTGIEKAAEGLRVHARSSDGRTASLEVDAVCINEGFHPQNEILRLLGAEMNYDDRQGQLVPVRSADLETTVPGVFAIGDCCGLGGAPAAREEGRIAGSAAGERVSGRPVGDLRATRSRLMRHRRFQSALWDLFEAPRQRLEDIDPDALVCRCEEVTASELRAAAEREEMGIGSLKRETRAGMGACQGRYCAHVLAPYLALLQGRPVDERTFFAPRPPVKPVPIEAVLAAEAASDDAEHADA